MVLSINELTLAKGIPSGKSLSYKERDFEISPSLFKKRSRE